MCLNKYVYIYMHVCLIFHRYFYKPPKSLIKKNWLLDISCSTCCQPTILCILFITIVLQSIEWMDGLEIVSEDCFTFGSCSHRLECELQILGFRRFNLGVATSYNFLHYCFNQVLFSLQTPLYKCESRVLAKCKSFHDQILPTLVGDCALIASNFYPLDGRLLANLFILAYSARALLLCINTNNV